MPGVINNLRGRTFGRLRIAEEAEPEIRDRHAYWPCQCECGNRLFVRGTKLMEGRIVSCGCWRADAAVRQAARLTLPPEKRQELARIRKDPAAVALGRKGGQAGKGRPKPGVAAALAKLTPEERSERARKAATARWRTDESAE